MQLEPVISRLQARVPLLDRRTEGAADFVTRMRTKALPQQTPFANVIPLGIQGGNPSIAAGSYEQPVTDTVGVMLTIRSDDATGRAALAEVDQLITDIIAAIAGWAPGDEVGVFALARAYLLSMDAGTLIYQIEFTINDQLRITP